MNNAVYDKTMKNMINRIDVKLVSNQENYLKLTSKPSYMSRKIFDNDLVATRKSKATLGISKPSKVLMCELHYYYIKNK